MSSRRSPLHRVRQAAVRRLVRRFPGLLSLRRLPASVSAAWQVDRTRDESGAPAAVREDRLVWPRFVDEADPTPPPAGVAFATVCTDAFAPGLELLIAGLLERYPAMTNPFHVFHDGRLSPFVQARLAELYPHFVFDERDPARYGVRFDGSDNHRRIGSVGYLTIDALHLDADRVVILDADLLLLGDLARLWAPGDDIRVVPDIGQRPYGVVTRSTGRVVINSGVISVPRSELGRTDAIRAALERSAVETDPDIAHFADQKFWNVYLADRDVELLPQSYNTIKNLIRLHYPDELGSVHVLHFTGPKPWLPQLHSSLVSDRDRAVYEQQAGDLAPLFQLWKQEYKRLVGGARIRRFHERSGAALAELAGADSRPSLLIGNGPSLLQTDFAAFAGYRRTAFNWFVNHDRFDEIAPDDLIVPSHMLFGGWNTVAPELPEAWVEALRAHEHRPRLWFSSYFRDALVDHPGLAGYDLRFFLLEDPLRRRIAHSGHPGLDLGAPLIDANTGVLTVGVPLALHVGSRAIALTGCDSDYASERGSYFYSASRHKSASTEGAELVKTWAPGGEGPFGYRMTAAALADAGVRFADATVGGRLPIDRIDQADAPAFGG